MNAVQEIETAIAKLSPQEMREVAAWLEDFVEDQLEVRPEFLASIDRGNAELAAGQGRRVNP